MPPAVLCRARGRPGARESCGAAGRGKNAGMTTAGAAPETIFQVDGPVAVLTFNRPEARNALTWGMYEALVAACERVDADAAVRVFVLRGAGGKAFASGTDISQFRTFVEPAHAIEYEQRISAILTRLDRVTKPAIAQIEGFAVGAGCGIALACDLRVATPGSTIGIPIARTLGNVASTGTYGRLVDYVGPARAKEMLFTGRLVPAAEALATGLFTRLAEPDAIEAEVRQLAQELAANAPLTIRATKEMTRRIVMARRPAEGDGDLVEMCYMSADFKEGVDAFLNKRKPRWTGR